MPTATARAKATPMARKQARPTTMIRVYVETAALVNKVAGLVQMSAADAFDQHLTGPIKKTYDALLEEEYRRHQESKESSEG